MFEIDEFVVWHPLVRSKVKPQTYFIVSLNVGAKLAYNFRFGFGRCLPIYDVEKSSKIKQFLGAILANLLNNFGAD